MTATRKMKIIFFSFLGAAIAVFNVIVVFLGIYAYGNPDPRHCFYINGLDTTALNKQSAITLA